MLKSLIYGFRSVKIGLRNSSCLRMVGTKFEKETYSLTLLTVFITLIIIIIITSTLEILANNNIQKEANSTSESQKPIILIKPSFRHIICKPVMFPISRPRVTLDDRNQRSAHETPHAENARVQSEPHRSHPNRNLAVEELLHSNNRENVRDPQHNVLR